MHGSQFLRSSVVSVDNVVVSDWSGGNKTWAWRWTNVTQSAYPLLRREAEVFDLVSSADYGEPIMVDEELGTADIVMAYIVMTYIVMA